MYFVFNGCSWLKGIEIPDSVTELKNSAFENCSSLGFVYIPSSVNLIGDYMFNGCSSLIEITIPSSFLILVGIYAKIVLHWLMLLFHHLWNNWVEILLKIVIHWFQLILEFRLLLNWFKNCTSFEKLRIPPSVTVIDENSFKNCSLLTELEIPIYFKMKFDLPEIELQYY